MKVFKIELLVIDFDGLGEDGVRQELMNVRYANDCIAPDVKAIEARDIEWSDDHPLNKHTTADAEYKRLFTESA
jgi:hypothetical protein